MTDKPKKKKKFLKIFTISVASFVLFCLIAFWVITSSAFITGVILPIVGDISAEHVDLSILQSRVKMKNVVYGLGKTPLVKAEILDVDFSFSDFWGGRFVLTNMLLDKAVITISDETQELFEEVAPTESLSESVPFKSAPIISRHKKPEKIFFDFKNMQITNSSVIWEVGGAAKNIARMEFDDVNINLPELKNNTTAILTLKSRVSIKSNSGIMVDRGDWTFTLSMSLDGYLHPHDLKLYSKLDNLAGTINGVKINDSNFSLQIEGEGDEKGMIIKKCYLRQMDNKLIKTNIELGSYINFDPFKIKGKVKIAPLSSEISNIICQFTRQINPGTVGAQLLSDFEYSDSGFSAAGQLKLTRNGEAIIAGKKYNLPELTLNSKYDFKFDSSEKSLSVKYLNMQLQDRGKKVLSLNTDRAFTYFFKNRKFLKKLKPQVALELRQLDLSMLKLLQLPNADFELHNGRLNGDIVCILDYKQKLRFGANIRASDLDFEIDSQRFKNMGLEQKMSGFISKDFFLSLPKFNLNIKKNKKDILSFYGVANVDFKKHEADFSLDMKKLSSDKITDFPLPEKTINDITAITRKLEAFYVTAALNGSMRLDEGTIKLKPVELNVFQQDKKVLNLSIQPHDGMIKNLTKKSTLVLTINNLPTRQVNELINDNTLVGGYMNGQIIAKIKDDLKLINLNTSVTIDNLELLRMKRVFKNLRFNLGFTASMLDFDKIKIRQFACGMRQKKKVILGLSGFGDLEISKGGGNLDLALDYLNHKSLNIITPGALKNGIVKGDLKINIEDRFRDVKIKSKLNMMQLVGGSITDSVSGKSAFNVELSRDLFLIKEFFVSLNNKNGKIVSITGSTILPKGNSSKDVIINLKSTIIDIDKINKLFAHKTEKNTADTSSKKDRPEKVSKKITKTVKQIEPWEFNFGTKSYNLLVDLRGVKYSSKLTAHLRSKIIGKKRKMKVKYLEISTNDDKVNFRGDFVSTPKGIKYDLDLKSDKLNLNPIFDTFLDDDLKKMRGVIKNFRLKLAGTGLQSPVLWDNMKGFARSDFENVKIPNDFSKTNMGKIFLLPFEIMVKIQEMVPDKVVQSMGKAARYVLEFQRDMKVLKFETGKMRLNSNDGIIKIENFQMHGKVVKNLSFVGKFGLGSHQILDLKSTLDVNGIVLPVDMSGTVENPKINYTATTVKFMGENAFTILDVTNDILENSGTAKKILDSIFKR